MTKKENFAEIRDILVAEGRTDLVDFVDNEVALITKKNSYKSTKPTKNQIANGILKGDIENVLSATPMSVDDIILAVATNTGVTYSIQKVSAIVGMLVDDGVADRTYIKRKAFFTLK